VADELERRGIGFDVTVTKVPIVCGACLFDLAYGDVFARPTPEMGRLATIDAFERGTEPFERGSVGAGTGCTVGKVLGMEHAAKAGIGEGIASAGALACAAVSAVNALGDVVDPKTGEVIAGVKTDTGETSLELALRLGAESLPLRSNTTISCVVTNASLTKAQALKVAQMASDGYARTISPTHTPADGHTIFVLATGEVACDRTDLVGMLATRAIEDAIIDAARKA